MPQMLKLTSRTRIWPLETPVTYIQS
jgi:hypothetical protein